MNISEMAALDRPKGRELLEGAPPAVVRVWDDGTGTLLMGGAGVAPGTRMKLREVRGNGLSLGEALAGRPASGDRRAAPPTGSGDVIMLDAARASGGELYCGAVSTRMHDGLRGEVQAVFALARPSRLSVSRFGATQYAKLIDPTKAMKAATPADVLAAATQLLADPWLGGRPGFIVRNAHKPAGRMTPAELATCVEIDALEGETAERFARRLVEVERILQAGEGESLLADGAAELIPSTVLPMGREQMFREGGNLTEPAEARVGAFSRQYVLRGRTAFVPSFVIVGDEPEFKFKAPTGKMERRCVGIQPRQGVPAVSHARVATPVRAIGTPARPFPVVAPAYLFKGDEPALAAKARADRRGPDPEPVAQAGQPSQYRAGPVPRTGAPGRAAPRPAPAATFARIPSSAPRGGDLAGLSGLASLAGLDAGNRDEREDDGFSPG